MSATEDLLTRQLGTERDQLGAKGFARRLRAVRGRDPRGVPRPYERRRDSSFVGRVARLLNSRWAGHAVWRTGFVSPIAPR
jgi:hypothetical protein